MVHGTVTFRIILKHMDSVESNALHVDKKDEVKPNVQGTHTEFPR